MPNELRSDITIGDEISFAFWKESIRYRVETANHTSSRARYTLIFLSLVSAGFIMSIFSYFYSWNKDFAFQYLAQPGQANMIRDGIIREWLSTQTYQLPILGIKIMASDIQIFGPLVLMIVSTWNYYEVRREHYTIGRLLGDVYITLRLSMRKRQSSSIILSQEIYHRLIGYTVFNVIPYDNPISGLDESLVGHSAIKKPNLNIKLRRAVIKLLTLTPLISISFIAITRILTFTLIRSPVTGNVHQFKSLVESRDLRAYLLACSLFAVLIAFYICYANARKVFKLDNATRRLLDDYQIWAFDGEERTSSVVDNHREWKGEIDKSREGSTPSLSEDPKLLTCLMFCLLLLVICPWLRPKR